MALTQAQFRGMVTDHGPALFRMAFRMVGDSHEAEDIVQETYRSAWKSRHGYEEGRSQRAWLAVILRRRAVDHWRGRPRPKLLAEDGPLEVAVPAYDVTADEYTDEMQRALNQLSPELRDCLLLVVVGELTHQEAADLMEIPLGTVLSRVCRARKKLRQSLLALAAP